jgi:subtilisin family serine protease
VCSGILTTHVEFDGRASFGANFVGDKIDADCNGHGTHVAGTVGGELYGVAKNATLIAVRLLCFITYFIN